MNAEVMRLHADHERRHWWFMARRRIVTALVRELVPPSRDRLIADIGCGTGGTVVALAREYDCIGIDTSPDAIEIARTAFPECNFLLGDVPDGLGEAVGRADLFLLMDVLEHVRDDVALFSGLMAAAKPGALALITVPADPRLWSSHDLAHMHYRRYTPELLEGLWAELPVTSLLLARLNTRLYPLVRLARALGRVGARAAGPAGTDLSLPPAPLNRLLTAVFAGESATLLRRLRAGAVAPDGRGVSLLAVVRREAGTLQPRTRTTARAAQDLHDPERTSS